MSTLFWLKYGLVEFSQAIFALYLPTYRILGSLCLYEA